MFRGLPVASLADCDEAQAGASLNFEREGGVELAFCSTTTDRTVALAFSKGKGGVLLRFELNSTTRAAGVQWLSQYPEEAEWLLPPYTMLRPHPTSRSRGGDEPAEEGTHGMRELRFEATVRVPFQELNLRCADLESPPCTPRRDSLPGARASEATESTGLSVAVLERALLAGRVAAGIISFKRGFFGGCGLGGIVLYCVLGGAVIFLAIGYASNMSHSVSPLEGNGPVITPLLMLGASCFGLALEYRAFILLRLNIQWRNAVPRCGSQHSLESGGSERMEGTVVPNPSFEGSMAGEDARSRELDSGPEDPTRWERRAVDNLPKIFSFGAVWMIVNAALYVALMAVYASKGYTVSLAPTNPPRQGEGISPLWMTAGACAGVAMFRSIAVSLRAGRKRSAQYLFTGFALFCGVGLAVMNLPKAVQGRKRGAASASVALQRGLAGLGASCYCVVSLWSRFKADREAAAKLEEDTKVYNAIFRTIRSRDVAGQLGELQARSAAANRAAGKELAGAKGSWWISRHHNARKSLNDPRQPNTRGLPVCYSGVYLADLYARAMTWSSEFRQIVTKLAVLSGCRLEVPSGREFDGIKDSARAVEKVCRVYGGRCDRVLDVLRATVVADNTGQMLAVLKLLHGDEGECFDKRMSVWRVKNKMDGSKSVQGGFRNVHLNLMLKRPEAAPQDGFLCELQIHHREMWDAEQGAGAIRIVDGEETTPHGRYIRFRNNRAE